MRTDAGAQRTPRRRLRDRAPPARLRADRAHHPGRHRGVGRRRRTPRRLHPQLVLHRPLARARTHRAVPHRRPNRARARPRRHRPQPARRTRATSERPIERLEAAMRRRDDEDLALDRIDDIGTQPPSDRTLTQASRATASELSRRSVDQLQDRTRAATTSASATTPNTSPTSSAPHAARAARRSAARTKQPRASLNSSDPPAASCAVGPRDPTALALERERLKLAEHHAATAAERERELAAQAARPRRVAGRTPGRCASAPPSSKRSSRSAAASTCTTRWSARPRTCWRHSASLPISREPDAPGGKPPNASRPTASTTPSPTTTKPSGPTRRDTRTHTVAASTARPPPSPAPAWLPRRTQPRARAMNHDNGQAL